MIDKFAPQNKSNFKVVRDLDAILADPVGFNLHSRVRMLKPVTSEQFLLFMQRWQNFNVWKNETEPEASKVLDRLHEMVSTVCDEISREDVSKMAIVQVAALVTLICDTVSGQVFRPETDDSIKKKMRKTLEDFPRPN